MIGPILGAGFPQRVRTLAQPGASVLDRLAQDRCYFTVSVAAMPLSSSVPTDE